MRLELRMYGVDGLVLSHLSLPVLKVVQSEWWQLFPLVPPRMTMERKGIIGKLVGRSEFGELPISIPCRGQHVKPGDAITFETYGQAIMTVWIQQSTEP